MLLFSTVLSIDSRMDADTFIRLVIEWNQNSPHGENRIRGIRWNGEHNILFEDRNVWLDIKEYQKGNTIAARYEKKDEDGVIWDTDYVMNFDEMKMAIRLDRSYTQDAFVNKYEFSTPHFINTLIDEGYVEFDNGLPIMMNPYRISDNGIGIVRDIILGEQSYELPVVYVSRSFHNTYALDVNRLSYRLKGVAHVLVQEDVSSTNELKEQCDSQNEYNGAIGLYYPNKKMRHRRYIPERDGTGHLLLEKVCRAVIQYSNSQTINARYTWPGLYNAVLAERLEKQRQDRAAAEAARDKAEKDSVEIIELLDAFDDELRTYQRRVEDLTRINESLEQENQGLKIKIESMEYTPALFMGKEEDLFQGEIKEVILGELKNAVDKLHPGSRRRDIILDIIQSSDYQELLENKAKKAKQLLKNYTGMSEKLRKELEKMGFVITEDGKHYKLTYYNDNRYILTFGKTPSDGRAGLNNAQELIRKVF